MAVTPTHARMAHAHLERLDAEDKLDEGLRYEVLNGELVIRGASPARHAETVAVLAQYFCNWTMTHGGRAFAGPGLEIGDHQLVPDLAFIGRERIDEVDEDGFHVAPDLVVEVTSPGTRSLDLHERRDLYDRLGVPEYWVVDLAREAVLVHRRDASGTYQVTELASGTVSTELAAGLEVPVAELLRNQ